MHFAELQALVDTLYEQFHTPVTLTDHRRSLLAYSAQPDDLTDSLRRHSLLARALPPSSLVNSQAESLLEPAYVSGDPEHGIFDRYVIPLRHDDVSVGYLYLIDPNHVIDLTKIAAWAGAFQRAAQLLDGLWQERAHHASVIQLLLSGNSLQRDLGARESREHLWPDFGRGALRVASLVEMSPAGANVPVVPVGLLPRRSLVGEYGGRLVAIVESPDHADEGDAPLAMIDTFSDRPESWLRAGVGRATPLADIHRSFRDSFLALELACSSVAPANIVYWETLGTWQYVLSLEREDALSIADARAAAVIREDRQTVRLILGMLAKGASISNLAQEMHLHRTTVYSRLRRVSEKYGIDFDDPDERASLLLGLRTQLLYAQ
jgi:hypothetical protein